MPYPLASSQQLIFKHPRRPHTSIHTSRETSSQTAHHAVGLEEEERVSYPVQINHQGHVATIDVREGEPILQALERQSRLPNTSKNYVKSMSSQSSEETKSSKSSSLALSQIPHECRRGNCLTCSSRIVQSSTNNRNAQNNILANVDNGLSPTIASEITNSGYILTCCSYVTGPGVVLELDQNDEVWDIVYKKRVCNNVDSKQLAMEAQARLLRRVDEENVGKWKKKMEDNWDIEEDGDE